MAHFGTRGIHLQRKVLRVLKRKGSKRAGAPEMTRCSGWELLRVSWRRRMVLETLDQKTVDSLPHLPDIYDAYGVQVNALSVSEIFALYEHTGFLYPEKAARLFPHLGKVRENWRRMLSADESLLYVLTAGDKKRGRASLAVWRTTHHGWMSQHLVCENNPYASRAVMLAAAAGAIRKGADLSAQNWFRPENRFPARVFGSMVQTIGESLSSVQRHAYFALPRTLSLPTEKRIRVVPYDASHQEALLEIASAARGSIYIMAEELPQDVEFNSVDELYRRVGLRRTRHVWLAYRANKEEPIAATTAYPGQPAVKFSYLENRCDLLLQPTLPESEVSEVASALLSASSAAYKDFELDEIPVIAEEMATHVLFKLGAEFLRHYCQGIWLKNGHPRFYRHVDGFYSKLLARMEKQELQAALVGQER